LAPARGVSINNLTLTFARCNDTKGTADGVVQRIHAKRCELLARGDRYALTRELLSSTQGLKPAASRSVT